jgi:HAMP domain-containing protein
LPGNKEDLMNALKTSSAKYGDPFRFELGREKYVGAVRELRDANGQIPGNFLAFRSLDRELYGFRQFQRNALAVGFVIMIFAFLISYLGAKRITEPLRHLTNAINEVKEGNYDVPIEIDSADEVGMLAGSFKKLLGELKEKAQLVQYLSNQPGSALTSVSNASTMQYGPESTTAHPFTAPSLSSIGPGTNIANRYEVQSVIGTGGMGVVLKARDRQLDEVVALKLLKSEVFAQDPAALERFKQELKLARIITHRHVVRTYDYSELDNYHVISMEYVKGITLKQLIQQRGTLPLKIGLQIGKQICAGLDAAHEKGVVHRDIKPQNILLESGGDVKIMDFGIARVANMQGMTMTGTVMGTPDYMSPEQAQGLSIDHRTDVYSTGVVLYEVFCGQLPFTGDNALAVLNKHIYEQPTRPTEINPQLPVQLEQIVLTAMAKNVNQRYQNISELYKELDSLSSSLPTPLEKTA